MASIFRPKVIHTRWQTFYHCDCPESPPTNKDWDYFRWYERHYLMCPPRKVVTVNLPAYPIEELV